MAKKQEITVIFDLSKISSTCEDATTFKDDTGNQGPAKSFDSPVYSGGKVIWKGTLANENALSNNSDQRGFVHILSVFKKNPKQISLLLRDVYYGNGKGEVNARAREKGFGVLKNEFASTKSAITEDYNISFLVGYVDAGGNMNYKVCTIDPKIRMA